MILDGNAFDFPALSSYVAVATSAVAIVNTTITAFAFKFATSHDSMLRQFYCDGFLSFSHFISHFLSASCRSRYSFCIDCIRFHRFQLKSHEKLPFFNKRTFLINEM